MYLYNNFTKPLPVTALEATADVVRRDAEDDDIGTPETFSLTPSADAAYLRLLLPETYSLPIALDVRVVFAPGQKRELFNFSFRDVTGRP